MLCKTLGIKNPANSRKHNPLLLDIDDVWMSFFKWEFRHIFVSTIQMNIGIVIKEVRKQKGVTQLDLSEQSNLSERTIQRIENNETEASHYSLKSIGEILGIDLQEIRNKNSMMFTSKIGIKIGKD